MCGSQKRLVCALLFMHHFSYYNKSVLLVNLIRITAVKEINPAMLYGQSIQDYIYNSLLK
jgi:hypothetical protein